MASEQENPAPVIILMGVSGSGKTTVGVRLARALGATFVDADDFHPPANVRKMRRGVALDDADRQAWLRALADEIDRWAGEGRRVVLACSALKAAYRDTMMAGRQDVRLVYLKGSRTLIAARLARRRGHFMPAGLLDSQFAALEEPPSDSAIDIRLSPDAIVSLIRRRLGA